MAASFPDDSVFATDGSGNVSCASVTCSGVRVVAADTAAITLTDDDHVVYFSTTGAGSHTIAATALTPGKVIHLCATAISTGTYALTTIEGTLTFNAANEMATVIAVTASTFRVVSLQGATIV